MMEKDIIDIVSEKEFIELTAAERAELKELCSSEEEYNELKSVFAGVAQMSTEQIQPKAETKERLDDLFLATYPKGGAAGGSFLSVLIPKGKPLYKQPLLQIAAVLLLLLLVVPLFNSELVSEENPQVAQVLENKDDEENPSELMDESEEESKEDLKVEELTSNNELADIPTVQEKEIAPATLPVFNEDDLAASEEEEVLDAFDHPDGIYMGSTEVMYSQSGEDATDLLDLLSATF